MNLTQATHKFSVLIFAVQFFVTSLNLFQLSKAHAQEVLPPPVSTFDRLDALNDPENRIDVDFKVPNELGVRTQFWFDVYTKYGSDDHIIHHTLYPWIIFTKLDTRSIVNPKGNRFFKYNKTKELVRAELRRVRRALTSLSKKRNFNHLSSLERQLFDSLAAVPGKRKKVFREAAQNVRIQLGQMDFFRSGLASSSRYLPDIEAVFIDSGLPVELTRLPFVESSFNVGAESKVGASGIWQIMPRTGKSFLLVSSHVDERNSPLKASLAAVKILKSNFRSLKSWPLAITAYNHGPGGIREALRKSRTTDLISLIKKYHQGSFKFASANFYTSFLAVLHAEKYHLEIFADDPILYDPYRPHQIISLKKPLRFKHLVKRTGLSSREILNYNLDLNDAAKVNALIPRGYKLILPVLQSVPSENNLIRKNRGYFTEAALTISPRPST